MSKYCYEYPRPAVSADGVLFGFGGEDLNILLIERGQEPFRGKWAFPGGFMNMDETTEQCAMRELKEETGIENLHMEQLGAFSDVDRDPRGRVISVVYFTLVRMSEIEPVAGDDAANARWYRIEDIPALAFDHDLILSNALERLKTKLNSEDGFSDFKVGQLNKSELNKLAMIISKLQ